MAEIQICRFQGFSWCILNFSFLFWQSQNYLCACQGYTPSCWQSENEATLAFSTQQEHGDIFCTTSRSRLLSEN